MTTMSMTIKGLKSELDRIKQEAGLVHSKGIEGEVSDFVRELKIATPVDTGKARDSWGLTKEGKDKFSVASDVSYMENLNQGTSKQAPAHFIETVALRHGKPVGAIVTTTP